MPTKKKLALEIDSYREYFQSQVYLDVASRRGTHSHSSDSVQREIRWKLKYIKNISNGKIIVRPSTILVLLEKTFSLKDLKSLIEKGGKELKLFLYQPDVLEAFSYSYDKEIISWLLEKENINLKTIYKVCSSNLRGYSSLGDEALAKFMKFLDGLGADEGRWKEIVEKYGVMEIMLWTKADFTKHLGVKIS